MPATLQISFRNMDPSSACEDQVRGRVAELDKFYDRIIACHVVLEEQHRHHQQGRIFHVRVDLVVPGREIVGIDCLPLILQHGSLHCITMQLPKGMLAE